MSDFHKQIRANGLVYAFRFHPVVSPLNNKYFVQGEATGAAPVAFEIIKDNTGKWHIIPPAPSWVFAIEEQLTVAILEHRRKKA